jgi:hypothetical protein
MSRRVWQISALVVGCSLFGGSHAWAESEDHNGHKKDNKNEKADKDKKDKKDNKDGDHEHKPAFPCSYSPQQVFKFIAEHADELKIAEEQKKQLRTLREEMQAVSDDPEVKELQIKAQDLQRQLQEMHAQIRELIAKKGGMTEENLQAGLRKVLNPEQLAKLEAMLKDECERHKFKPHHCSEKFHAALKQILTPEQFAKLRELLRADEDAERDSRPDHPAKPDGKDHKNAPPKKDGDRKDKENKDK